MKVTQTVKDYIKKQVAKKFPKTQNELDFEKQKEIVAQANMECNERANQAIREIAQQVQEKFSLNRQNSTYREEYHLVSTFGTDGTEGFNKALDDSFNRKKMIEEKVEEIIVMLELGGTKDDLDEMLKEI